ncbi:MAG TPA: heavy metal-binding domain-containing protein [Phycisphaerae bacterium]|nr:heavy metal-binding domain-containing protein [Phycisphaerae bacterium]
MPVMTGLSGNEIYCLHLKNMTPGELVVGNSVYSLGFVGNIGAGLRNMMGGEVTQVTQIIHEGRTQSFQRMQAEAQKHGGIGISGVSSELRRFHGNIEFLSVGSTIHAEGQSRGAAGGVESLAFSTAHDAQELYCILDANYSPHHFVFGNVAYSVGITGGLLGSLKSMARGEVKEFSDIFNHTRHLALQRISADAQQYGANAILGIETSVLPFQGVHEMMMIGTACHNPNLPPPNPATGPVTSDLTAEETWNMAAMGYAPLKLVLGTAVYSLGIVGGFMAALKSFSRGEVNDLTSLIYDAREHAIGLIRAEANAIGADDVVGIKTHIHDLGNLLEFMAIGTAVKKLPNLTPQSALLPPQAIIKDKDTWITTDNNLFPTPTK